MAEHGAWLAEKLGLEFLELDAPGEPPAGVREPRMRRPSTGSRVAAVDPDASSHKDRHILSGRYWGQPPERIGLVGAPISTIS